MPKKYSVEMKLLDAGGSQVGTTETINVEHNSDAEATTDFNDKVQAARAKGKGQGQ
jgi:hypothetical protein